MRGMTLGGTEIGGDGTWEGKWECRGGEWRAVCGAMCGRGSGGGAIGEGVMPIDSMAQSLPAGMTRRRPMFQDWVSMGSQVFAGARAGLGGWEIQ